MTAPNKTAEAVERLTEFASIFRARGLMTLTLEKPQAKQASDDIALVLQALSTAQQSDARVREALEKAEQFIANGVELGFIRMPETATDPAHETLPAIRTALASLTAPKPEEPASPAPSRVEPVALDFDAWLAALEEDVVQGEYGYEPGEFTVFPEGWRQAWEDGLTPSAAFRRACEATTEARKAEDALKAANALRIKAEDRAAIAEAALTTPPDAQGRMAALEEALLRIAETDWHTRRVKPNPNGGIRGAAGMIAVAALTGRNGSYVTDAEVRAALKAEEKE